MKAVASDRHDAAATSRTSAACIVASIVALLVVGLHWAQPPTVVAQIDLSPPFDPANTLAKCAFAWAGIHTYFGSVDNCGSWTLSLVAQLAFAKIFGSSFGQALVFALPVILSWLGAFAAARALGARPLGALAAGWLYAFNPMRQQSFGEFATGEICAALLPWIVYWIVVAAREPERRGSARAAIATIAAFPLVLLATTPQLLFELVVGAIVVLAFAGLALAADGRAFARWCAGAAGVAIVASLWWTIPNAVSYFGVAVTHATSALSVGWTFARASLLNELRFCATWTWQYPEYDPWAVAFDRNALLYASGFVPAAAFAIALLVSRGIAATVVRFFGAFALAMLFVAKGPHPPLEQANLALYAVPGMFLFIEPFGAQLWAAFGFAACGAMAATQIASGAASGRRRATSAAFAFACVLGALIANTASVTGAIFHEKSVFTPDEHFALPDEWIQTAAFINGSSAAGGVVVLPPDDHYQADYAWGYRGIDVIGQELLHRDVLMPGATYWYTQAASTARLDDTVSQLVAHESPLLGPLLSELGVRYAIVRADVHPVSDGVFPDASAYDAMLDGSPVRRFGAMSVYDLGPPVPDVARIPYPSYSEDDAGFDELVAAAGIDQLGASAASRGHELESRVFGRVGSSVAYSVDREPIATDIPTLVSRSEIDATSLTFEVFDPQVTQRADVWLGVWPRTDTAYTLAGANGWSQTVDVPASPVAVWCVFHGVALDPGVDRFTVHEPSTFARTFASFLPPRFAADQPSVPDVHQVRFADVRPVAAVRASSATVRSVDLHATLRDDPLITISTYAGPERIWKIEATGPHGAFECGEDLVPGQTYRLASTVRDCLAGIGETLTLDSASRFTVVRLIPTEPTAIGVPAPLFPLGRNASDGHRATRAGRHVDLSKRAVDVRWRADGLALLVDTGDAAGTPLVFAQTFSPTWIAYDVGAHRVLAHGKIYGWRNSWACRDRSTVLIFNWLSALGIVLLALGMAIVAIAWVRR